MWGQGRGRDNRWRQGSRDTTSQATGYVSFFSFFFSFSTKFSGADFYFTSHFEGLDRRQQHQLFHLKRRFYLRQFHLRQQTTPLLHPHHLFSTSTTHSTTSRPSVNTHHPSLDHKTQIQMFVHASQPKFRILTIPLAQASPTPSLLECDLYVCIYILVMFWELIIYVLYVTILLL